MSKSYSNLAVIPGRNNCVEAILEPLARACGMEQEGPDISPQNNWVYGKAFIDLCEIQHCLV